MEKAAEAWSSAARRPRPPMETGSFACSQDLSETAPPMMRDRASLVAESKSWRRCQNLEGSVVCKIQVSPQKMGKFKFPPKRWENEDHFSNLVLMRTKSSIEDLYESTVN